MKIHERLYLYLQLKTLKDVPMLYLIVFEHTHGLEEAWNWSSPVIHFIALHWLVIQTKTQMDFSIPCQIHQTQPCCTLHQQFLLLSIAHILQQAFPHFRDSKRKWDLPIHLMRLLFSISHVIQGKICTPIYRINHGHPSIISYDLGIHLSPHLRAPHNNMPCIRHCSPQVLVSSRKSKQREYSFPLLILNFEWSNYSLIQGLYYTSNIRW